MSSSPQTPPDSASGGFWKVWEKIWWLVGLAVVVGFVALAVASPRLAVRTLSGFFIAAGLASLVVATRWYLAARASERWRPVHGVILRSGIRIEVESLNVGSRRDTDTQYFPDVEVEYAYEGRSYRTTRVILANVNWPRRKLEEVVARYPIGGPATIWVNPADPAVAVLERGIEEHRGRYVQGLVIAAFLTTLGLVGWFLAALLRR